MKVKYTLPYHFLLYLLCKADKSKWSGPIVYGHFVAFSTTALASVRTLPVENVRLDCDLK